MSFIGQSRRSCSRSTGSSISGFGRENWCAMDSGRVGETFESRGQTGCATSGSVLPGKQGGGLQGEKGVAPASFRPVLFHRIVINL